MGEEKQEQPGEQEEKMENKPEETGKPEEVKAEDNKSALEEIEEMVEKAEAPKAEPKKTTLQLMEEKMGIKPKDEEPEEAPKEKKPEPAAEKENDALIFALRTTANREDQVMDFMTSNITKKKLNVYSIIRPHGMRGYIFVEAESRLDAEQAAHGIPYARGILPKEIAYSEMEHMIEPMKRELTIKKNDIVEIISGPFKRETAKITRIDEQKEEVVVELVEAAVPIPITLKIDAVKVIRRDTDEE